MLYDIEMTLEDLNIKIHLKTNGCIEDISVDGESFKGRNIDIIYKNLQTIQREVAWQWCQDQERQNCEMTK